MVRKLVRGPTSAWSLRVYFALLFVLVVSGSLARVAYLDHEAGRDARRNATQDARFSATAAAEQLDNHVALLKATAAGLAANPQIAASLRQSGGLHALVPGNRRRRQGPSRHHPGRRNRGLLLQEADRRSARRWLRQVSLAPCRSARLRLRRSRPRRPGWRARRDRLLTDSRRQGVRGGLLRPRCTRAAPRIDLRRRSPDRLPRH